jgi:hypothetical protein
VVNILISLLILLYIVGFSVLVFKLLIYHLSIIYNNLTTYQDIKNNYIEDIDYFFVRKLKKQCFNFFNKLCKSAHKAHFRPSGIYKTDRVILNNEEEKKIDANFKPLLNLLSKKKSSNV